MKINKTRIGKLKSGLEQILGMDSKKIEEVLKLVNEYEKNNLDTIEKLKRSKTVEMNKINGALKQAIHAHGPITKELIGSASKRIYGSILSNDKPSFFQRVINFFKKMFK